MDVDQTPSIGVHKLWRENLHVPGKHDEIDPLALHKCPKRSLNYTKGIFGGRGPMKG